MEERGPLIELTADIVSAHVSNNSVAVGDVANLVEQVHGALRGLGHASGKPEERKFPAISARASIKPDYIICMECGRKHKTLKRHLQSAHGLTPDQYRQAHGLGRDYPMAAPSYSQMRQEMARSIGLGRKKIQPDPASESTPAGGRNSQRRKG